MSIRVIELDESELDGGKFPSSVEQTVRSFLKLDSADRRATNPQVYENYVENRDYSHCFLPWMLLGASQVWRYNRPTSISVMRDFRGFDDSSFSVVVAFDCKWQDERGLALVYHEGRTLIRVGPDDGHIHDFRPPRPDTDEQADAGKPDPAAS
ncbi:MAG: hypothetical protein MI807_13415 [Verrucomicrobiales bacterium]|nr:hypothetical protein [Verrucomicrobiales bacterium]